MKKLLSTVAVAALALSGPVLAQETTGTGAAGTMMLSGTGTTCAPTTAAGTTGTTTDTTASTTTGTTTDTTASTTGTTATTDTTGTTATTDTTGTTATTDTTGTTATTDTTGTTTGTATDSTAATGGVTTDTGTDTTATTGTTTTGTTATGGASSTMALSADNQIDATTARTALTSNQTNVERLSALGTPSVVCLVDLDTLAQSDATLKGEIAQYQANNAAIKSSLEANTALVGQVKSLHPTFDINTVRAVDIGPSGELVLYVIKGS